MNTIFMQSKQIGKTIISLGKNKKTFSSFVKKSNNAKIMEFLPWIEQGLWNFPMSKDFSIMFENNHNDLSKINNYDLSIIFIHQFGNENKIYLQHINDKTYNCVIQTIDEKTFGDIYVDVITGLCQDNPYVKLYNDYVQKKG